MPATLGPFRDISPLAAAHIRTLGLAPEATLWDIMRREAKQASQAEPLLVNYLNAALLNHNCFEVALSFKLATKLESALLPMTMIRSVIEEALATDARIAAAACYDLAAVYSRDPACDDITFAFLCLKGFHALQAQRITHWLWQHNRRPLAKLLQNQISERLGVDMHPAAHLGRGIMLDHATGIVVGETAVIEDDVSMLHSVTLGGTGNESGDRHPKIRRGVLLSAGCKIIGNIEVGEGAKVGAGSVVLADVPPHVTVAGVPAKIVGTPRDPEPALSMDHSLGKDE